MSENLTDLQKKKKTRFPISRIRRLVQLNEDVGKTTSTVPVVLSKGIELFLTEILSKLLDIAKEKDTTKICNQHFLDLIASDKNKYGFLKVDEKKYE